MKNDPRGKKKVKSIGTLVVVLLVRYYKEKYNRS